MNKAANNRSKNQDIMKNQDFDVKHDEIGILLVTGEAEKNIFTY